MIVSEVASIFQGLIKGLSDNGVITSLTTLQNHISSRNAQNLPAIMQQSAAIRAQLSPLSGIDAFQHRSIPIKEFLRNTIYGSLTIYKVAAKVLTFAVENPDYLPASGEVAAYIAFLNLYLASMNQFIQVANTFQSTGLTHSPDTIFLVLQLPRSIFDEDMNTLSKDLEEFDRFISGIHQLATGTSQRPKLLYTSSSDFLYYIQYAVGALPAFLPIFNQCLDSAERLVKVLSESVREVMLGPIGARGS